VARLLADDRRLTCRQGAKIEILIYQQTLINCLLYKNHTVKPEIYRKMFG